MAGQVQHVAQRVAHPRTANPAGFLGCCGVADRGGIGGRRKRNGCCLIELTAPSEHLRGLVNPQRMAMHSSQIGVTRAFDLCDEDKGIE